MCNRNYASLILLLLCFFSGFSQEQIYNYDVDIQLYKDGVIRVEEQINVRAEGNQIQHGLKRTLPLYRIDKDGNNIDIGYKILSVQKNNQDEKYHTDEDSENFMVYIGDRDIYLENGVYTYKIVYEVPFQVGFFDSYDELYWNVTGNEWSFQIIGASCTIRLPDLEQTFNNQNSCYTGVSGSTAQNCFFEKKHNTIVFRTQNLLQNEGFTVAASFPKGIVAPPSDSDKMRSNYKLIKHKLWSIIFGILSPILFLIIGRRNRPKYIRKPITPEFRPPGNWSPAIIQYLYNGYLSNKSFAASIVNLGVHRTIKMSSEIVNDEKIISISQISENTTKLSIEESKIYNSLFAKSNVYKTFKSNYKTIINAYNNWEDSIKDQMNIDNYFINRTKKIWFGINLTILCIFSFLFFSLKAKYTNYPFFAIFIVFDIALLYYYYGKNSLSKTNVASCIVGVLAIFIFVGNIFLSVSMLVIDFNFIKLIPIGIIVLCCVFYCLTLSKKTALGYEVENQIEGFRLYLKTAEESQLNILNPPERTPELFEALLPYAIALGLESDWGKKFATILEAASYSPEWTDDNWQRTPSDLLNSYYKSTSYQSILTQRARENSSSSSSSSGSSGSWSSGSSGGGSSGGGGGGGGGGGW